MPQNQIQKASSSDAQRSSVLPPVAQRERIGVRIEAILSQFWRDDATPDAVQVLEIEGWMDVLQSLSEAEIRAAWAEYQKNGPRTKTGRLYKPDAGALFSIAAASRREERAAAKARLDADQRMIEDREYHDRRTSRASPEAVAEIMRSVGASKSVRVEN